MLGETPYRDRVDEKREPNPDRYCEPCGEEKVKTGYGYACPSCNSPPDEEGF